MEIQFDVQGQRYMFKSIMDHKIASDTEGIFKCVFDFDKEWDGLNIQANWMNSSMRKVITTNVESNECDVPPEVMQREGIISMSLTGLGTNKKLTTFTYEIFDVDRSLPGGANTQPITPSQYEQFVATVRSYKESAEASKTAAAASATSATNSATSASASATSAGNYATSASGSASTATAKATEASNSATSASNSATSASNSATSASNSATSASTSATNAEASRQAIEDMTVSSSTLSAGSSATVTKTEVGGVVNLAFGIPKGDKGDDGEDGSIVSVSASGTSTDEVKYITIDGVEKKLAGGISSVAWNEVTDKPSTFPATLGETSTTAYRGDRGKIAYDHSQETGNAHNVNAKQIEMTQTSAHYDGEHIEYAIEDVHSIASAKYTKPSGGIPASDLASGVIPDVSGKENIFRYTTMPTAGSDLLGTIVQYIGTTDSNYTHGYFYQCIYDTSFKWEVIQVQPSGAVSWSSITNKPSAFPPDVNALYTNGITSGDYLAFYSHIGGYNGKVTVDNLISSFGLVNELALPTYTSDLTNDGEDGENPFISDAPSDNKQYARKNASWVEVQGGGGGGQWGSITGTLADQTDLQTALDGKQGTLVSGTNIKTVNGTSILGSGDIDAKDVFVATYGTTTYADVISALTANKVIVVYIEDLEMSHVATLFQYSAQGVVMISVGNTGTMTFGITSANAWSLSGSRFEFTSNKVDEWSSTPDDDNYPSEKLVKDSLDLKANQATTYSKSEVDTALGTKESTSNKVTSVSSASTDTEYASAKCLYDMCGNIESLLLALL